MVGIAMAGTTLISWWSSSIFTDGTAGADESVKAVALALFAILGVPLAVSISI